MKRLGFFLFIAVFLIGTVFAQNKDTQDRNNRQRDFKTVTIDGTLQLAKGFVAVASGDSVYYVPILTRYIGFIEGLKEGTNVSVEGYEFRKFIHPVKVIIGGKSYDFIASGRGPGGPMYRNDGFGPGCGSYGHGRNFGPNRDFGPGRGNLGPDRRNAPDRGRIPDRRNGGRGWNRSSLNGGDITPA